jgi:hypothetical protein
MLTFPANAIVRACNSLRGSRPIPSRRLAAWMAGAAAAGALASPAVHAQTIPAGPIGTAGAMSKGVFGPVAKWPLIPIHAATLPDGRVLSYGTDLAGNQGAFQYDVWDPKRGVGADAHLTLPNSTAVDSFCSAQALLPVNGLLMLAGGDATINNVRNFSNDAVNVFDFTTNTLYNAPQAKLLNARWYPSLLTLGTGETLLVGGRATPDTPVPTPHVFSLQAGWRQLTGAVSQDAYGLRNWSYPRVWQAPNGLVFGFTNWGGSYYLSTLGVGGIAQTAVTLPEGHEYLPSVMYRPGKILALRTQNRAFVIDINGMTPTSTAVTGVGADRFYGFTTVMADGNVLASGGANLDITAASAIKTAKIWTPTTQAWANAATAKVARMYHSISMLLPDGSVLTGGGGAPGGPDNVNNLNVELYYPPYLYKRDGSGLPAPRPTVTQAPPQLATWNTRYPVTVSGGKAISRATLVRAGSVTHTVDFDQRFIELALEGTGTTRTIVTPANGNIAPPGFYMLFVFDASGVPSVANIIRLS